MIEPWSRGSEWHRWDPHIHTPATTLNNQFVGWECFVTRVNAATPKAEALGVTNYLSIRGYPELRARWEAGELPDVHFLFPNVEIRLTIQTETIQGLNLHLLFSPEDPDHIVRIQEALGRLTFPFRGETYQCSEQSLIRLGREFAANLTDDEAAYKAGVAQFKVDFDQLNTWYRNDDWLRRHCLVAVAAGKDGTSGLQKDTSFAARRQEIERFAHIIFSGQESDRRFWLGKKPDHGPSVIVERYGGLKPCLHGCDAHEDTKILEPDARRRCWIKAEVSFEALRESIIEPEERVWIGEEPPQVPGATQRIRSCSLRNAAWFARESLELNEGLVAIIGPRGSGKTALADMIAYAADAFNNDNDASFITKARCHLDGVRVELSWADGSNDVREFGILESDREYSNCSCALSVSAVCRAPLRPRRTRRHPHS
jgi:AAA domain